MSKRLLMLIREFKKFLVQNYFSLDISLIYYLNYLTSS